MDKCEFTHKRNNPIINQKTTYMKKVILSAMLLGASLFGYAQMNVASIEKVALPEGVSAIQATISPDGNFVVLSQAEKEGLQKFDLTTSAISTVSNTGNMFDLKIADNGTVIFRESKTVNKLRQTALKAVTVAGVESTVVPFTRDLQGFAVEGSTVMAMNNGKLSTKAFGETKTVAPVASIDHGRMVITVNGESKVVAPQGTESQSYLWPSVSPDGTRVVYYLARYGAYVCNIDGSNPVFLGGVRAPRWYDNNTVVGMNDQDNGHVVTSSKIVAIQADGSFSQMLTDDASMAMYPTVSNDGSKIAFTNTNGELFIINITK